MTHDAGASGEHLTEPKLTVNAVKTELDRRTHGGHLQS